MKMKQKFAAVLAALLLISNGFSVLAEKAKQPQKEAITTPDNAQITDSALQHLPNVTADEADMAAPEEAPAFLASIKFSPQGYIVEGSFMEFTPDISLVQPLYSLDGENWQICGRNWDLGLLGNEDEKALEKLQNQTCLYANNEPLKSYLAGQLDCFYLKLRLTKESGITYESRAAMIERGGPKPVPEEYTLIAKFPPSMQVRKFKPYVTYGRYQITISEDSTPEEVSAFLPDTLPIEIQLFHGDHYVANGIVDCPVTWKPLVLPQLIAGESVTISDAAEEILVPSGTLLHTPAGIFQLNEPLGIHGFALSDEISLVLNIVAENENPTGVLSPENTGLQVAFNLKPTGAAAIRVYALPEGKTEWMELSGSPLSTAINAQPSAASSGYAFVINNGQEPYRSYLEAVAAEEAPVPFLIGLKIEGGVYDGKQLILAWPSSYELPLLIPDMGGAGGNEGNAGADNKDDSTTEGQRPNLPQNPDENTGGQKPDWPQDSEGSTDSQKPDPPQDSEGNTDSQKPDLPQDIGSNTDSQKPDPPQDIEGSTDSQQPDPPQDIADKRDGQPAGFLHDIGNNKDGQQANLPKTPEDKIKLPDIPRKPPNDMSDYENQRYLKKNYIPGSLVVSMPPFIAAQAAADMESGEKYTAKDFGRTAETDMKKESAVPNADEEKVSDTSVLSGQEEKGELTEKPNRSRETRYQKIPFPIAAAILVCICIAAVIGKKGIKNKFSKA